MKKKIILCFLCFSFLFCSKKNDEKVCDNFHNKEECIENLFGYDIEVRGAGFIISTQKYQYFYKKNKEIEVSKIDNGTLIKDSTLIVNSDKINLLIKCFKSLRIQKLNGSVSDDSNVIEMKVDNDTFVYYIKDFNHLNLQQKKWLMKAQKCSDNLFYKTYDTEKNRITFWESDCLNCLK